MPPQFRLLVLFASLCACAFAAASAPASTIAEQAQDLLDRSVAQEGPGVVMLVAKGDSLLFRAARGRAQIELGVPLSADHVFRIASITKMFTAATVLKLALLGKLSIDDPLAKYLPDFPHAGDIRLRELLNHTSGVSDAVREPQPGFSRRDVDTAILVAEIRKRPLDFPPGTRWAYSNAGYALLGAVIEQAAGEPWPAAMRKNLFEAAGLTHTGYGSQTLLIPDRAAGYSVNTDTQAVSNAAFINSSVPAAAGALVSTADDLWHWMRALAEGRVIGEKGFRQMTTPTPDLPGRPTAYRYGFGMYIWRVRGSAMVGHTGQINGFASFLGYLPEHEVTVVVLANSDGFDARTAGKRLAAIALGNPFPDVTGVAIPDSMLQSLQGEYRGNDGTVETLSVKNGRLWAQRNNGKAIPMQMTADGQLHFVPAELSYFRPLPDDRSRIVRLDYFEEGEGPPKPLLRKRPP